MEEIDHIIQNHYLPRLKLLQCSMEDENSIHILSHAPVDESKLKIIANLFCVPFQHTPEGIMQMIDKINQIFQILCRSPITGDKPVELKKLAGLMGVINEGQDRKALKKMIGKINEYPGWCFDITRNDFLESLCTIPALEQFLNDRYENLSNMNIVETSISCNVTNIHGHVSEITIPDSIKLKWKYINLDGLLGLGDINKGIYTIYQEKIVYRPEVENHCIPDANILTAENFRILDRVEVDSYSC